MYDLTSMKGTENKEELTKIILESNVLANIIGLQIERMIHKHCTFFPKFISHNNTI